MAVSIYRFGSFEIDTQTSELRKNGLRIRIEDQPFRILSLLVSRPGEVVTREELKDALWADETHVDFDRSLTRAVNKVRTALSDIAATPRFIETLPKRGYRFIAPVTSGAEPAAAATPPPKPNRRWLLAGGGAALAAAGITGIAWRSRPAARISSIAVLPLDDVTGDLERVHFANGMTDQLIAVLSRVSELRVVRLKSVLEYRGTRKSLTQIASELNVDGIVEGSIATQGNRIRINTRLIAMPGERTVWSQSYERDGTELLALQNEISRNVAHEIGRSIRPDDESRFGLAAKRVDPNLHSMFLRGHFLSTEPGRAPLETAISLAGKVIAADPAHAGAHTVASNAWIGMSSFYERPNIAMPKAKAAALKAIELDPRSDAAHEMLGFVHLHYEWDSQAAGEQFRRAIELNPNSSDAFRGLALQLMVEGQARESEEAVLKAVALNPRSLRTQFQCAFVFLMLGRMEDAIRQAKNTLEWEPAHPILRSILGMAYLESGRFGECISELEKAVSISRIPTTLGFLACGYARVGRKAEAAKLIGELFAIAKQRYVCPFEVGVALAMMDRHDEAFAWMDKGLVERADCMIFLRREPWLKPFRKDPRYAELVRKVGFPA